MLSYPLRLECQNKFRIDTQSRWASDNPPLRDIASNNKGRVDNFQRAWNPLTSLTRQSFRMNHNMPLIVPRDLASWFIIETLEC